MNIDNLDPTELARLLKLAKDIAPGAEMLLRKKLDDRLAEDPARPVLDLLTADQILTTDWPEPTWAIPNLLPVGLAVLAGKPKAGKSWLALQIALAVASGGVALGQHVEQGPVLYLALEDTERRLKDRMQKQGWTLGLRADFLRMGQFKEQIDDLQNGGGDRLARQIEQKSYRFVVIDTLSRSVYGDQNDVVAMTSALTPLQMIAHDKNCVIALLDHHNKFLGNPDCISNILGSTAKGAMADSVWGLYREQGKAGAKLAITGRDVEEKTLALTFDGMLGCWHCEGDADALVLTEGRVEVLEALDAMGKSNLQDIANAIGKDVGNTYKQLADLINAGKICKTGKQKKARYEVVQ